MLHGPGRIEKILNDEMEKLYAIMKQKIAKQDEEFLARIPEKKKKWIEYFALNLLQI